VGLLFRANEVEQRDVLAQVTARARSAPIRPVRRKY
jgi:hypothetical protein